MATNLQEALPAERRERRRRPLVVGDDKKQDIVTRVRKFAEEDRESRTAESGERLQRYAKYRQWTTGKDWPFDDSSDAAVSDMMSISLRAQDTLHNAVMSARPAIVAKATHKEDREKQDAIDQLLDFQFFEEAPGETIIGEMADAFINDGVYTVFVPWVKEEREITDTRIFDPIPRDMRASEYFLSLLRRHYAEGVPSPLDRAGWDWRITSQEASFSVSFYTRAGKVEMVETRDVEVFNGPRPIVMDWEDVLHPPRVANLQMPSQSNPGGSPHVVLIFHPTIDEITRLQRQGYYDMLSAKDRDELENFTRSSQWDEHEIQKDDFQGVVDKPAADTAKPHRTLTMMVCFDVMDIDNDGINEDVVWWVLEEPKRLLRAKRLSEVCPARPPRRPFAEASMLPVRGRRNGISMLEILEGLHDLIKQSIDMTIDAGTIANAPFGFYRQASGLNPEIIRLNPGELYPVPDPKRDIEFPNIGNQAQSFGLNLWTLLHQEEERLTNIGDFQMGRVPPGRSSALRTVGGMQMLAGQGEARPERMLRRFFLGLSDIWNLMHQLDIRFLPKKKSFLIMGIKRKSEDPFASIESPDRIDGKFLFQFHTNAFNASKSALQESLGMMMQTYMTDLGFQLGLIDPAGAYRLFRDFGKAWGGDPDQYLAEPPPGLLKPKLMAEEVIGMILRDQIPDGTPAEGAMAHLQKLAEFFQSDEFGLLSPQQMEIFKGYIQLTQQLAQAEQQQANVVTAAGQSAGGGGGQRQIAGPGGDINSNPQLSGNELLDETLPSAGGGGAIA